VAAADYAALIAAARDPGGVVTLAFAGVIAQAGRRPAPYRVPIAGLAPGELAELLGRLFPGLSASRRAALTGHPALDAGIDEFQDLVDLLLEHRSRDEPTARWLAYAVATACMGADHLWQDLGLPHRRALSALLEQNFASLFRRNVGDMKWKKFLYKQLCEREESFVCKSPSCASCTDYSACFGPEEGAARIAGATPTAAFID